MSNTILPHIAFIGRAGAGKTTAAELLVKHFGYERLSFAAPLKVMLGTTTDRGRMQEFGTDVVRVYEPDAWVNLFIDNMQKKLAYIDAATGWSGGAARARFTVDDARFGNEFFKLKVEGFLIVRVDAERGERTTRLRANGKLQDESQLEHASELEVDDVIPDYVLDNNGTGTDLLDGVTAIINREQR